MTAEAGDKNDLIELMLETCLEEVEGDAREFIQSLSDFFDERGFLTDKQFMALEKFYDNIS